MFLGKVIYNFKEKISQKLWIQMHLNENKVECTSNRNALHNHGFRKSNCHTIRYGKEIKLYIAIQLKVLAVKDMKIYPFQRYKYRNAVNGLYVQSNKNEFKRYYCENSRNIQ